MSDNLASLQPKDVQIDDKLLKKTFLEHLNYIYYGKHHLIKFFIEVKDIAKLQVLKMAIQEGIDDTKSQIGNWHIRCQSTHLSHILFMMQCDDHRARCQE